MCMQGDWVRSRHSWAGGTLAGRVNFVRGHNSAELQEVRAQLERKLTYLGISDSQILIPVMYDYLDLFCIDRGSAAVHYQGIS
jgi:hypothetical protein